MAEDIKRVALNDEEIEAVAGGAVNYTCTETNRYCWGEHTPDVRYGFYSKSKMLAFIADNYDYYGESGIFDAMIDAGLIYPL